MKKKYCLLSLLTLFLFALLLPLHAQTEVSVPSEILSALNEGNANVLKDYLDTNVEVILPAKYIETSQTTSAGHIEDFFKQNKVRKFTLLHQGHKDAGAFLIGTLTTNIGQFRINILMRSIKGTTKIHQLRIEKI